MNMTDAYTLDNEVLSETPLMDDVAVDTTTAASEGPNPFAALGLAPELVSSTVGPPAPGVRARTRRRAAA